MVLILQHPGYVLPDVSFPLVLLLGLSMSLPISASVQGSPVHPAACCPLCRVTHPPDLPPTLLVFF